MTATGWRRAPLGAALACALAGCKSSWEVSPEDFAGVSYGVERSAVLQRLEVEPRPLLHYFGEVVAGRTWRADGCEAQGTSQTYVLLFAGDELVSLVEMSTADDAWDRSFQGEPVPIAEVWHASADAEEQAPVLPGPAGFAALGAELAGARLDLATHDFSQEAPGHMNPVEGTISVVIMNSPFLLMLWPVSVAWFPIVLGSASHAEAHHEDFLDLIEALQGGESTASVIAALGEPRARSSSGAEEVLVYAPQYAWVQTGPTSLGFTNDRLLWIAWRYTPLRLGDASE
jgi:hypothetical protein